jgi:hypothetical protein
MITCGCGRRPVDRLVPVSPRPTLDVLAALWRLATLAYRYSQHRWTDDPRFAEFLAGVRSLAAQELATMPCSWLKKMHGGQEIYQAHRRPANRLPASHRPRAAGAVIVLRLLRRSALPDLLAAATTRPPITCPGSGSSAPGSVSRGRRTRWSTWRIASSERSKISAISSYGQSKPCRSTKTARSSGDR